MKSLRQKMLAMAAVVAVSGLMMASLAGAADKLMVKDGASNTVFDVTDTGIVAINTGDYTKAPSWANLYMAKNSQVGFAFDCYQDWPAAGVGGTFRFARGNQGAPAIVKYDTTTNPPTGDRLGFFLFSGYDGVYFLNTAGIAAKVDGAVTAGVTGTVGAIPTKITFETGDGRTRPERMVITSSGNVGINMASGTVPTSKLQVVGLPVWPDNATAIASGGLSAGAFYRTSTGVLMVVY